MAYSIIAVGGSGKQIATVVRWMARLGLVEAPQCVYISDPDEQEVLQQFRTSDEGGYDTTLRPVPGAPGNVDKKVTLQAVFHDADKADPLSQQLLPLLFKPGVRKVEIDKQFYANPSVAATAFSWCSPDFDNTLKDALSAGDVVVVGSLFGGTGAGVLPRILSRLHSLREDSAGVHISFIALTQWFKLPPQRKTKDDASSPTREKLESNWKMGAKFLLEELAQSPNMSDIGWIVGPTGEGDTATPQPERSNSEDVTASPLLLTAAWLLSVGFGRGRSRFAGDEANALWRQNKDLRHKVFGLSVDKENGQPVLKGLHFGTVFQQKGLVSWDHLYALTNARIGMLIFIQNAFKRKGRLDQAFFDLDSTIRLLGDRTVRFWRGLGKNAATALRNAVNERFIREVNNKEKVGPVGGLHRLMSYLDACNSAFPDMAPSCAADSTTALSDLAGNNLDVQSEAFRGCCDEISEFAWRSAQKGQPEPFVQELWEALTRATLARAVVGMPKGKNPSLCEKAQGVPTYLLPGTPPHTGIPAPFSAALLSKPLAGRSIPAPAWDPWAQLGSPESYCMPTPASHLLAFAHRVRHYIHLMATEGVDPADIPAAATRDWEYSKALWLMLLQGDAVVEPIRLSEAAPRSLGAIIAAYERGRMVGSDVKLDDSTEAYPGNWICLVKDSTGQEIGLVHPMVGPCPAPTWFPPERYTAEADAATWALLGHNVDYLERAYDHICSVTRPLWTRVLQQIVAETPRHVRGNPVFLDPRNLGFMPQIWLFSTTSGAPMPFFLLRRVEGFTAYLGKVFTAVEQDTRYTNVTEDPQTRCLVFSHRGAEIARIHGLGSGKGPGVVELEDVRPLGNFPDTPGTIADKFSECLRTKRLTAFDYHELRAAGTQRRMFADWGELLGDTEEEDEVAGGLFRQDLFLRNLDLHGLRIHPDAGEFHVKIATEDYVVRLEGLFKAGGAWHLVAPANEQLADDRSAQVFRYGRGDPVYSFTARVDHRGRIGVDGVNRVWEPLKEVNGTLLNHGSHPEDYRVNGLTNKLWVYRNLVVMRDADKASDEALLPGSPVSRTFAGVLADSLPQAMEEAGGVTYRVAVGDGFEVQVTYPAGRIVRREFSTVAWFPRTFRADADHYAFTRLYLDAVDPEIGDNLYVGLDDAEDRITFESLPNDKPALVEGSRVRCLAVDTGTGDGGLFPVHWSEAAGAFGRRRPGAGSSANRRTAKVAIDLGTHSTKLQVWQIPNPLPEDNEAPGSGQGDYRAWPIPLSKAWAIPIGTRELTNMQNRRGVLPLYSKHGRVLTCLVRDDGGLVIRGGKPATQGKVYTIPGADFAPGDPLKERFSTNFKWTGKDTSTVKGQEARAHLGLFIEQLLYQMDCALDNPDEIKLLFSYPAAFDEVWLHSYRRIWEDAIAAFNRAVSGGDSATLCSLFTDAQDIPSESNAAVFAGNEWMELGVLVGADLGGGTLDLSAVTVQERGIVDPDNLHCDSWEFGGQSLEQYLHRKISSGEPFPAFTHKIAEGSIDSGLLAQLRDKGQQWHHEILGYFNTCAEGVSRFIAGYLHEQFYSCEGSKGSPTIPPVRVAFYGFGWLLKDILNVGLVFDRDVLGVAARNRKSTDMGSRMVDHIESRVRELLDNKSVSIEPVKLFADAAAGGVTAGLLRWADLRVPVPATAGIRACNGFTDVYRSDNTNTIPWHKKVGYAGQTVDGGAIKFDFAPPIRRFITGEEILETAKGKKAANEVVANMKSPLKSAERWGGMYFATVEELKEQPGYHHKMATGEEAKLTTGTADFLKALKAKIWTD